jgi:non-specific serine/threonine protein kinase
VLLDLGAARRAISDKSHQLTAILKVNYAPIEQYAEAEDLQQGPWTDLYSLAAVVYTCLRNDPPLPATSRVVRDRLPTLASVAKTVQEHLGQSYSEKFVSAVSHALAVQPADRPQSVQEFIDEMTLEVVDDLARFDWRAGMGAQLLPAANDISRSQLITQSQTIPAERESARRVANADQDVTLAPAPRHAGKSKRKSRKMIVWPVAILMMTAVLGFWIIRANDVVGGAPLVVAPEPAAAPVVAGPASMASEPQDIASLPVIPTPPTVTYGSAASPVPAHPVSPEGKVKVASAERKKTRTDTSKTADTKTAQPVRKPAQGKTARPTSLDQCAEKSFLLRLWCVHSECQKAENASLPVCIEDRERNTRPN